MAFALLGGLMADQIGVKYILTAGISLFTIGFGTFAFVAGPDSNWLTFLLPAIIAGAGMGMTFAPMTTIALRNIAPRVAGAASGVLNTTRHLAAPIGSAVVAPLLPHHLATTLHDQAGRHSASPPVAFTA